ncbi:MAG: hypothetical protein QM749_03830 [Aquabacterium sp.]
MQASAQPQDGYESDKLGRVTKQTIYGVESATVNADTGLFTISDATTGLANAVTQYQYNGNNQVTRKTEATSEVLDWAYDTQGREISRSGAAFKDFEGKTDARQVTGTEYNALGLVARTVSYGKVTADNRYTRYFYDVSGQLQREEQELTATQTAVTRYQYDKAGHTTSKGVNRSNASGVVSTDMTTYLYDLAGQQTKQTVYNLTGMNATLVNGTMYTALQTQETRYNVYGQIINKRTYADTAPTGDVWQEFTEYDVAGRVSKTNTGDGVAKAFVYDANGNASLKLTSAGADLKSLMVSQMLGAADVHMLASRYDKRNQLVEASSQSGRWQWADLPGRYARRHQTGRKRFRIRQHGFGCIRSHSMGGYVQSGQQRRRV